MAKTIKDADGKTYKQVEIGSKRKRTLEVIFGIISFIVSIISLASGFGMASFADSFGGGGSYTGLLLFGILLSIVAFILVFFINKKRVLIGWSITIIGVILLFSIGEFGVAGGVLFIITGLLVLFRK
ncbi:hypothetical protein ABVF11_02150 [Pediococcus argentinicus]|uniref:hypothetical protein n=1 Tax=Pediococcus argentinicus TaxID=480391 RepID=UPI00338DE2D0